MSTKFGKQCTTVFDSNETDQAGACEVIASRSCDKLKTLYIHHQSAYGYETR